jgi:glycine/D-amino acid oxidase-like deaminating enzyme
MRPDVLIVGQGLAGSLLGWELERAGVAFAIADSPEATGATTAAAAGIVNPITGRRLVKTWRLDELLPLARATYQSMGQVLDTPLWREMRVRRIFADERERATLAAKRLTGELAPYLGSGDDTGCWFENAGCVDLAGLLTGLRARWQAKGTFAGWRVDPSAELGRYAWVIDCRGVGGAECASWGFVPWEFSKGEVLEVRAPGLAAGVILNRRHWLLPLGGERALVGATHEPAVRDRQPTPAGRDALEASAAVLAGNAVEVLAQRAGIRVNLPDKRPVAGPHPQVRGLGIVNGLGAKGVLFAPFLAQQWTAFLLRKADFLADVSVARFAA